mmetsp:Transcript_4374/g.5697  ORF Transcript_4374/g.5697 Transcript_4374/m.5697 type:complete len:89 (+) Transcript_4374:37-303(+)
MNNIKSAIFILTQIIRCMTFCGVQAQNDARPNIIVMQPDDLFFFDPWGAPPNNPSQPNKSVPFPDEGLPWMDKLRKQQSFYHCFLILF